jgi:hypothetical protein
VSYRPRYLEWPLKAHGINVQRPATQAQERDELVIEVWPKRKWVALKKDAEGAPHPCPLRRVGPQLLSSVGHQLGADCLRCSDA